MPILNLSGLHMPLINGQSKHPLHFGERVRAKHPIIQVHIYDINKVTNEFIFRCFVFKRSNDNVLNTLKRLQMLHVRHSKNSIGSRLGLSMLQYRSLKYSNNLAFKKQCFVDFSTFGFINSSIMLSYMLVSFF